MTLSTHAAAAKAIRQELKKNGIKGRVTCSTYSMGSSVTVYLNNEAPWVRKAVEAFANDYQYGHFDGMQDLYEYSNSRDDIPQVKFVSVNNNFDDEMYQKAYDYLRANWNGYQDHPAAYDDARNEMGAGEWVSTEVWQVLNGSWDSRCSSECTKFWNKPHVRMAA